MRKLKRLTTHDLKTLALPQELHLGRVGSILIRVGSCDFVDRPCFCGQKKRSTKSHELNTKLVTTELDF